MGTDEDVAKNLVFLKQLVHKLNSALARHQPDPDISVLEPQSVDIPAPWLVDPRHLSPLLTEYEAALGDFEDQLRKMQNENLERKHKLKTANDENREIRREIDQLKVLIREGESTDLPLVQGGGMVQNLQRQLELALNQKDEAMKMCRDTMYQLDKLRHSHQTESASVKSRLQSYEESKQQNEQLNHANLNLQMLLESSRNEIQTLTNALHQQESDFEERLNFAKESKSELQKTKLNVAESRQKIKSLETELQVLRDKECESRRKESDSSRRSEKMRFALDDAETRLAQALQSGSDLQQESLDLKSRIRNLESDLSETDKKESHNIQQVLEAGRRLEAAVQSRDVALQRCKEKEEEKERVMSVCDRLIEESAKRVKEEEERSRRRSEEEVERVREEMQRMELELSEMREECDRAKRAKRVVESEFESLRKQESEHEHEKRREEWQSRVLVAERAKCDAMLDLQNVEEKMQRLKLARDSDILSLVAKYENAEGKLKRVRLEADESQHERLLLTETLARYQEQMQKVESSANQTKLESEMKVAQIRAKAELRTRRLEARLRSLEDSSRNETQNLHSLLADQQRLSAKWKEELESASSEYESKIYDLQKQLSRVKKRYCDVTDKWKNAKETKRIPDLSETNRRLRARLHETEYRLISATEKLGEVQGAKTALTLKDLRNDSSRPALS